MTSLHAENWYCGGLDLIVRINHLAEVTIFAKLFDLPTGELLISFIFFLYIMAWQSAVFREGTFSTQSQEMCKLFDLHLPFWMPNYMASDNWCLDVFFVSLTHAIYRVSFIGFKVLSHSDKAYGKSHSSSSLESSIPKTAEYTKLESDPYEAYLPAGLSKRQFE